MRCFQSHRYVYVIPLVVAIGAMIGCPPPAEQSNRPMPGPSTTVPPAVTAPPSVTTPHAAEPDKGAPPAEQPGQEAPGAEEGAAVQGMGKLVLVALELPAPAFRGTPVPLEEPNVEKPRGTPRPPFLAPEGTVNLARGKPVLASSPAPASGELDYVTDGDKEASDFAYLELRPGTEWVEIDLGEEATIYGVLFWHNHAEARVYRDVIVQVSDDPDFLVAETVFNNDYDNSSGMGIGPDMGYVETSEGKLVDCGGVEGRYVRLYSKGNHVDGKNHYTEVEVFGKPSA